MTDEEEDVVVSPDDDGSSRSGLADAAARAFDDYRSGETQRMSDLVEMLTPLLWHTARGAGAGHQDARDAVQTTWLRLVDKADTVRDPQAVLGWLLTTVRRIVYSRARRDREQVVDLGAPEHDRPDTGVGPEQRAELSERQQVLWEHVGGLDERCQYLLRVVAFAQRPDYASISERLEMPVGSIGPTRGRCLEKLRQMLETDSRWERQLHA